MVHGKYSSHLLPACSVAWAQLALDGFCSHYFDSSDNDITLF